MKKHKIPKELNKVIEKVRREQEIENYGKYLGLRPSIEHKSKKQYTRKIKHKNENTE